MPKAFSVTVNGAQVDATEDMTALAAILLSGTTTLRRSVSGEQRGALCGMGVCFECRVTINGEHHCRSCQIRCAQEMDIRTDE
ncbi:MAG TPA: 2Fe-2S iron-sulfur cluster-binding protein [Candidatus Acidoferrales bacterium]|nr:2Fe-2S iron-sulfur cluster-binding protein [Candidatus Acidoferrales bacterium]